MHYNKHIKFDFTKSDYQELIDNIFFTDRQLSIIQTWRDSKGNLTNYGLAMKLGMSESTLYRELDKISVLIGEYLIKRK